MTYGCVHLVYVCTQHMHSAYAMGICYMHRAVDRDLGETQTPLEFELRHQNGIDAILKYSIGIYIKLHPNHDPTHDNIVTWI